jgi:hypothetical protein
VDPVLAAAARYRLSPLGCTGNHRRGRQKLPEFRAIPVSWPLLERLDCIFAIRPLQKDPNTLHTPLWTMGHSSTKTTEVYFRATGDEERNLFLAAWDE